MLALEAEPRVRNVLRPGRVEAQEWRVAPGAVLAELALVLVLVTIDTRALAGAIDSVRVAFRTLGASLQVLVEAEQRKTRVLVVVEGLLALAALDVAARARLVGKLTSMSIAVLVAAGAAALTISHLDARFVAALAAQLGVVAEERKPHSLVIEGRASPRPSGVVALGAIPRDRCNRVNGRVAVAAGPLGALGDGHGFAAPQMTPLAAHRSVLADQPQAELGMVDRGPPEGAALRVTPEATGRLFRHRVRGKMAVDTGPPRGAATQNGLLVALGAGVLGVFPLQDQAGVLRVSAPLAEPPATERAAWLMTGIAFAGKL